MKSSIIVRIALFAAVSVLWAGSYVLGPSILGIIDSNAVALVKIAVLVGIFGFLLVVIMRRSAE